MNPHSATTQRLVFVYVSMAALTLLVMISVIINQHEAPAYSRVSVSADEEEGLLDRIQRSVKEMSNSDIVEQIKHHIYRRSTGYSNTDCESTAGGVCRRSDRACGGEYQTGLCNRGASSSSSSTWPGPFHQCCKAAEYVPTDANGNPITGTEYERAEATVDNWRNKGYKVPNSNCADKSNPGCPFWAGGLNRQTIDGLDQVMTDSGCSVSQISITAAAESAHAHEDYGNGRTAENGYVLRVEGSNCLSNYIKSNFGSSSTSFNSPSFEDTNGNVYQEIDPSSKTWDIMFNMIL